MVLSILSHHRRPRSIFLGLLGFVIIAAVLKGLFGITRPRAAVEGKRPYSKALITASLEKDDSAWLYDDHLSDWIINRYVVDNPLAEFKVPKNKGREAMVYLTYMIDFYDNLPDVMVFMHGERYQWHNDDPVYDGVAMLQNLQLPYVVSEGYANLRCVWIMGCPSELKLDAANSTASTQVVYFDVFKELFPGEAIPPVVGVACCGQFAVSREKVRERSLDDYRRYRQWIFDTSEDDHVSGRVFEYTWHMIFGKPPVHCPNAKECYCRTFGLCKLECERDEQCGERWRYPAWQELPKDWPAIGLDGKSQDQESIATLRNAAMSSTSLLGGWFT